MLVQPHPSQVHFQDLSTVMKPKVGSSITGTSVPGVAMGGSQDGSTDGSRGGGATAVSGGDFANMGNLKAKMLVAELGTTGGPLLS